MALSPGGRLGVYEVQAAIGAGGMGEVFRARDTRLGRTVALKVLPDRLAGDPDRLARFLREAQLLASLSHPNIAGIHGLEESGGVRALVLEFVDGETLARRIERGPIAPREAFEIARQIADALEAAHEQGIVHRDLKPGNVQITPGGTVKVLDFGLAKLASPAAALESPPPISAAPTFTSPVAVTNANVVVGTVAYMSPEQARGQAVDKRTDIWAFGCVLYEMLTGRAPFAGQTYSDVIAAILEREPSWAALPPTLPTPIARLLHRLLDKDVKRRVRDIGDARVENRGCDSRTRDRVAGTIGTESFVVAVVDRCRLGSGTWPWRRLVASTRSGSSRCPGNASRDYDAGNTRRRLDRSLARRLDSCVRRAIRRLSRAVGSRAGCIRGEAAAGHCRRRPPVLVARQPFDRILRRREAQTN